MKVHAVRASNTSSLTHYATLTEAVDEAQAMAGDDRIDVDVEEVTLVKMNRDAIVRLLNMTGGYVESSRIVASFDPRGEPIEREA